MKSVKSMSKKERKAYYAQFRGTWQMNPVTRKEAKNKFKERKCREIEKSKRNAQTV